MLPGEYSLASVRIASLEGATFGAMSAVLSGAFLSLLIALVFSQPKWDNMFFGAGLSGLVGLFQGAFCSFVYTFITQLSEDDAEKTGMNLGLLSGVISSIFSSYYVTKKALTNRQKQQNISIYDVNLNL